MQTIETTAALCVQCGRPFEKFLPDESPGKSESLMRDEQEMIAWANGAVDMVKIVSEFQTPAATRFKALERVRDVADHYLAKIKFGREGQ